ncbi:MAG: flagellar protein FlgN [Pirellulaceae bacterium]|nr:flagellar protein FlgN [Pirellulaceae bacterium]
MNDDPIDYAWDDSLVGLLEDLSQIQEELLAVLAQKRRCMAAGDVRGMLALAPTEQELQDRLQACHQRRSALLATASEHGVPGTTLSDLAATLAQRGGPDRTQDIAHASARMRLLQHHSLTNWVLAQKALLHVAQLLEIIATGGRLQPTYGTDLHDIARGALVDQEA